ncbi:superoxide dismutase family protein [Spirillospora sp. CA-294931]|uniref:superoxide dismutase family protein n=1 Tax=Spirillospora sp. CA-294931 TaxID=3240042 RepID=UPI003D8C363F
MAYPKRTAVTLTAVCTGLGLLTVPAAAAPAGGSHVIWAKGPTYTYDKAYGDVTTRIRVKTHKGTTSVRLKAKGFPAAAKGKTFGVHVHQKACGPKPADAGPHYQNPNAKPGTPLHDKEIWLDVTVGRDGEARSKTTVPWVVAKGDAGSVVVHAEPTDHHTGGAGDRLLCTTVPFGS